MLICIWPHFHGQNMNTWGLSCSYFLLWHPSTCSFLTHESLPSTLLSRSGPMGVPLTVPYNNDITALPVCQPGREKKEMLIVISISPLTQNISGSVHVDNRSQVVRSVCDLCFFPPPISGLGWMRTVYTRSVEQWKTERSKQVFPLINTELFFLSRTDWSTTVIQLAANICVNSSFLEHFTSGSARVRKRERVQTWVVSKTHRCSCLSFLPVIRQSARPHLRMCPGVERWLRPRWFTAWTIILPVQLTLPCERGKERGSLWGADTPPHHERQSEEGGGNRMWVLELGKVVREPVAHERLNLITALVISCLIQHPLQAGDEPEYAFLWKGAQSFLSYFLYFSVLFFFLLTSGLPAMMV